MPCSGFFLERTVARAALRDLVALRLILLVAFVLAAFMVIFFLVAFVDFLIDVFLLFFFSAFPPESFFAMAFSSAVTRAAKL